jgi:putative addiction module killer protein
MSQFCIVRTTAAFDGWMLSLRDTKGRAQILARIKRIRAYGHFGDCDNVGEGVGELRIHVGPGYRVYFVQKGREVVLLLCGGDKSSQARDIARAKAMARMGVSDERDT